MKQRLQRTETRLVLLFILGVILTWALTPRMEVRIFPTSSNNQMSDIFPVFPNGKPWYRAQGGEVVYYEILLHKMSDIQISKFIFLPNDCVKSVVINNQIIGDLGNLSVCQYGVNKKIDLTPYLARGENKLSIVVANKTSTVGLDFYADFLGDKTGRVLLAYWITLWLCIVLTISQKMKLSVPIKICVCLNMLMLMVAGASYNYYSFSHDLGAHLDHISYLYTHWWRTDPFLHPGFRYPSLYHLWLAWLVKAGNFLLLGGLALRLSSLVFYTIFLFAGLRVIDKTLGSLHNKYLAQVVFLLWPLHYIVAFRINNDVPFYAFCTLSFLAWMSYVAKPKLQQLCIAVGFTSLSLIIKFNTLVLAPAILYALWLKRDSILPSIKQGFHKERILLGLLVVMPLTALGVGPLYSVYKARTLTYDPGIYGAQGHGGEGLYAKNMADAYGIPNISSLIDTPFASEGGLDNRQNVWAYLAKTMVFGESYYPNKVLARLMSVAFLIMALVVISYYFLLARKDVAKNPNLLLNALFFAGSIAGILFFRAQYNQTASQNFRYILPSIIPFIIAWSVAVSQWNRKGLIFLTIVGFGSGIALIAAGYLFYGQFFYGLS